MGRIAVSVCILAFFAVAGSAYALPEPLSTSVEETEVEAEVSAEEAYEVGLILLGVAHDIEQDDELKDLTDEYFMRKLWAKTKNATKKYAGKLKEKFKKYFKKAKVVVKEAVKELALELAEEAKKRAAEKATKVLADIFGGSMASYALEDSETNGGFLKHLCTRINEAGLALIEHSKQLREHDASR